MIHLMICLNDLYNDDYFFALVYFAFFILFAGRFFLFLDAIMDCTLRVVEVPM